MNGNPQPQNLTDTTPTQAAPPRRVSLAAVHAAAEITDRIPATPVYRQALAEAFAEIIERHTRSRELLDACQLAKEALTAKASAQVALAAIEKAVAPVE
jgi:hypothetical protein